MTDPRTPVGVNRGEHLRHGPNLMSDRTSGAWSACSLDELTAWKRPEPTKWAVVVKDGARARDGKWIMLWIWVRNSYSLYLWNGKWIMLWIWLRNSYSLYLGVEKLEFIYF